MYHSSISMINYREANSTMRTASGKIYLIEVVMVTSSLPFDQAAARYLCWFATLHMYLASATSFLF